MRKDIPVGAYSPINLTNKKNQLVADKLKFFSDCISLISLKSGEYYHYEVENHLSLILNLMYIAEGEINSISPNERRIKFAINQIQYVLQAHPLFQHEDGILSFDEKRKNKVEQVLQKIFNEKGVKKENLVRINANLNRILNIIAPTYIDDIIQCLFSLINCKHQLSHHQKELDYLARLVFSHFYYEGHSRERINGFIKILLVKSITIQGDRIYTDAPLPEELYTRLIKHNKSKAPYNKKLSDDIQKYLDNRTLKEQIDGFIHISKRNKYPYNFIFRVDGISSWIDEFEVLELKLIDLNKFLQSHSEKELEYAKSFFERPNQSVLVELSIEAYSQDEAVYLALASLKRKLSIIARRTKGRFSINQTGYTFPISNGESFWINSMPEIWKLGEIDISRIEYLERTISSSKHKELYLQLENILSEGYIEDSNNRALQHYRRFMQILYDSIGELEIKTEKKIPKEIVALACLLVYFERACFSSEIRIWSINIAYNLFGPFGIQTKNSTQFKKRFKETNGNLQFAELLKLIDHQHTKYEIRKAKYYTKNVDEKQSFNYYIRQLLFIKQYRDKQEHSYLSDDKIARKLSLNSYKLMNRILEFSFIELNKTKNIRSSHQKVFRDIIYSVAESLNLKESK